VGLHGLRIRRGTRAPSARPTAGSVLAWRKHSRYATLARFGNFGLKVVGGHFVGLGLETYGRVMVKTCHYQRACTEAKISHEGFQAVRCTYLNLGHYTTWY
jgi:hypothetical protein